MKDNIKKVVNRPSREQEVEQYLSNVPSLPRGEDPVTFWIKQEKIFHYWYPSQLICWPSPVPLLQ